MRLATILDIEITQWEELLIVGSYLLGTAVNGDNFDDIIPEKIDRCLSELRKIPELYARELCFEVLKDCDVSSSE